MYTSLSFVIISYTFSALIYFNICYLLAYLLKNFKSRENSNSLETYKIIRVYSFINLILV